MWDLIGPIALAGTVRCLPGLTRAGATGPRV